MREIVVNVERDGSIIIGGRRVDPDGLRAIVAEAVAERPGQKVTVRGDRDAPYANVARALDICKAAGVREPFLDTVPLQ
jgi:biopolymer transport protein ExbD